MAPIDNALKDLSTLATKLKGETDQLNEVIKDLNTKIGKTGIGLSVWLGTLLDYEESFEYPDASENRVQVKRGWDLGYSKIGDEWTLAVRKTRGEETFDDNGLRDWVWDPEEPMALAKAPRHIRVESAAYFEKLVEALAERAKEFIANIDKAKKLAKK